MYLAQKKIRGRAHFFIRESYRQGKNYLSRDLLELGTDPGRYIVYPGGNSFYIEETIEERLCDQGVETDQEELESIFWRFVHPEIRRALEPFRRREEQAKAGARASKPSEKLDTRVHIFDKRRIHFLKFGQMDQRNLGQLSPKIFYRLHHKSRDEIEQQFIDMETVLAPREYKDYAYVIFNLQNYFRESFANRTPQMLDQNNLDEHFIEALCSLNMDRDYWRGMEPGDGLHDYLIRYLIMYFDYDDAPRSFMQDYLRRFINSRRDYQPPSQAGPVGLKEASTIFGEAQETLRKMSRQDLARLYRKQAQKMHPDKGGDHDAFVKLTEAYHAALKTK